VHERALMNDLVRKLEEVARAEDAARVTRVEVRFGALSHFTPEHFREHFEDVTRGSVAEGAEVDAVLDETLAGEQATGVVLVSVEVENRARAEAS
jgi:hydrogenase nickel incorporation protein HypA/HybF